MNNTFWDCANDFERRFSRTLGINDDEDILNEYLLFSREAHHQYIGDVARPDVDMGELEDRLRDATGRLLTGDLFEVKALFGAYSEDRYFVNSENSRIFTSDAQFKLILDMQKIDDKGLIIPFTYVWYSSDFSKIPDTEEIVERGEEIQRILSDIVHAPFQPNGEFPTILCPQNTGVGVHEFLGHALEGHRMKSGRDDEGISIFKDKKGERIMPEFITIYDDPTQTGVGGHYLFDDEGVPAQRVRLVNNGILENYLHSRESAGSFGTWSNGHARASGSEDPVARMGHLSIRSDNEVNEGQLIENLKRECVRQGKEYGLYFRRTQGGMTLPDECFFNSYPAEVFRVYPNSDEMMRVRNVYVVGTPYQTMNNIMQTSDVYESLDGFCGAESGFIPASEAAPHALVRSLEVNAIPRRLYPRIKKPVIPKVNV